MLIINAMVQLNNQSRKKKKKKEDKVEDHEKMYIGAKMYMEK